MEDMTKPSEKDTQPGQWLWLSFADGSKPSGEQFLGVLVLKANDIIDACRTAHNLGLNPGGQVLAIEFPLMSAAMYDVLEPYLGRLLNAAECAELDGKLTPLVPTDEEKEECQNTTP